MKRLLSLFLASVMVLVLSVTAIAETNQTKLLCSASNSRLEPGDDLTLTISLQNVPNVKSVALVFDYDITDTFLLVSGEWLLTGALLADFDIKTTACGTAAIAYSSPSDVNGNIFKLKLKVNETATFGDTEIVVHPVIKNDSTTVNCYNASTTLTVTEPKCHHTNKTYVASKSSSCNTQGWDEYYYCDNCNQLFAADKVTEIEQVPLRQLSGHTGGEATCKSLAVCTVCGHSYGSLNTNNHKGSTYKINQKEPSCYEEGYTGDIYCSDCNAKLSSGIAIEKNAHSPTFTWSYNADYHWHDCQTIGCDQLIDKATHTGGEATCISRAICFVCGTVYGSVNKSNHKNTEVRNVKAATCSENGYTGDTYCKDCNTKIASGSVIPATGNHLYTSEKWVFDCIRHWHECEVCGDKSDLADHIYDNPCDADCNVCGYVRTAPHQYKTVWSSDQAHHWHECELCGHKTDEAEHDFGEDSICDTCGYAAYIPGDIDGNDEITDADAVYLLMHTFFPDDYPINQPCDFNGDRQVTDADAVYLLMYTFFPEDYPIA